MSIRDIIVVDLIDACMLIKNCGKRALYLAYVRKNEDLQFTETQLKRGADPSPWHRLSNSINIYFILSCTKLFHMYNLTLWICLMMNNTLMNMQLVVFVLLWKIRLLAPTPWHSAMLTMEVWKYCSMTLWSCCKETEHCHTCWCNVS